MGKPVCVVWANRISMPENILGALFHLTKPYMLGQADFVLLLLPSTAQTENFIDAQRLRAMKPTAWLLNFARAVVDRARGY